MVDDVAILAQSSFWVLASSGEGGGATEPNGARDSKRMEEGRKGPEKTERGKRANTSCTVEEDGRPEATTVPANEPRFPFFAFLQPCARFSYLAGKLNGDKRDGGQKPFPKKERRGRRSGKKNAA